MNTRLLAASLAALVVINLPSTAHACSGGFEIATKRITLALEGEATWSPEDVRRWAKWAGRLDALVPDGKTLSAHLGEVEICDDASGACTLATQTWDNGDPLAIFELAADTLGASRKQIAHARRSVATPLTVQVATSHDLAAATKLAARVSDADLELSGFFDAGGFDGDAHVVESIGADTTTYQVVVGAFLDREAADAAVAELDAELGIRGFVRTLDQSSVSSDEGC